MKREIIRERQSQLHTKREKNSEYDFVTAMPDPALISAAPIQNYAPMHSRHQELD
jgi:hypothetical protein